MYLLIYLLIYPGRATKEFKGLATLYYLQRDEFVTQFQNFGLK